MHASMWTLSLPPFGQVEEGADEVTGFLPYVHLYQVWSIVPGILLLEPLLE